MEDDTYIYEGANYGDDDSDQYAYAMCVQLVSSVDLCVDRGDLCDVLNGLYSLAFGADLDGDAEHFGLLAVGLFSLTIFNLQGISTIVKTYRELF